MSERSFQRALICLYQTIGESGTSLESVLSRFELSDAERASLAELIDKQKCGLLVFNRQLRHKEDRSIRMALAHSSKLAAGELDGLIREFASSPFIVEGWREPAYTVRFFAQYLLSTLHTRESPSKQLELIYLESIAAAVSLPRKPPSRGAQPARCVSSDLKLSCSGDVSVVRCTYDIVAVLSNPAMFEACEHFETPRWFLLFQDQEGEVRIMVVSSALAGALQSLQRGVSLGYVAQTTEGPAQRKALHTAVECLLLSGVPFVSDPTSENRIDRQMKRTPYDR